MRKTLLLLLLLTGFAAEAQNLSFGVTGRLGAFTTITTGNGNGKTEYGIGQQAALGVWTKLSVASKSHVQLSLLQLAERQGAGEITFMDPGRSPLVDAKVTDRNLAVVLQALYLYSFNDRWSAGVGAGARYEYLSSAKVKAEADNRYYTISFKEIFDNRYRRPLTLHLPVELQYKITEQFAFAGQLQVQLSNRLGSSETSFKEHDLGLVLGVNYKL